VKVKDMEEWAQKAFSSTEHLNPLQTKCFSAALHTEENLLICAPTGSGKTNVALLAILHEISKRVDTR